MDLRITSDDLRNGLYEKQLPEFYALKECVERSDWHQESVFNHTLHVLEELDRVIDRASPKVHEVLCQRVDTYTHGELLHIGTLFHDIAKNDAYVQTPKKDYCPGHEKPGAGKTAKILERFDLSEREKQRVIDLVLYHGEIHDVLDEYDEALERAYESWVDRHFDLMPELLILGLVDTRGSQLGEYRPVEYEHRVGYLEHALQTKSG